MIWVSKDGTKHNIEDMGTSHLRNCLRLVIDRLAAPGQPPARKRHFRTQARAISDELRAREGVEKEEEDMDDTKIKKQLETVTKLKALKTTIKTLMEDKDRASQLKMQFKHKSELTVPFFPELGTSLLAVVDDLIQKHYTVGLEEMQRMQDAFKDLHNDDMKDIHLSKESRDWLGIK